MSAASGSVSQNWSAGCLIAPALVLTRAHVVGRDRLPGDTSTSCRVALRSNLKARLEVILLEETSAPKIEAGEHPFISLDADVAMDEELLANGYPVYDRKPERDPLS